MDRVIYTGFPHSSVGKTSACNAGDPGLIPGSGRSPGEGKDNPLQYCLEIPMDRGTWHATIHGITQVRQDFLTKPTKSHLQGFPGSSAGKGSACNVGDLGSIPGSGSSPGEGNGYLLQYSGLENSLDCIVHGLQRVGVN